jgi:hypothetical protein
VAKVSLAGIHYPDATGYFGITDVTDQLAERGWFVERQRLYMADHYRAAADRIVRWALSESCHCNVEIAEWFPDVIDRQRLLSLLNAGMPKLGFLNKQKKVSAWLRIQFVE